MTCVGFSEKKSEFVFKSIVKHFTLNIEDEPVIGDQQGFI